MTIKHVNKNISSETDEIVVTNATLSNGILTFSRKNFFDPTDNTNHEVVIDLKNIKLRLVNISQNDLDTLSRSNDANDKIYRESHIFLVPITDDPNVSTLSDIEDTGEGVYIEYIWNDRNNQFEAFGSTRLDLDPIRLDISTLQSDMTTAKSNILTLQSKMSTAETNITSLQNNKVDKVTGKQLSTEDYTTAEKTKLSNIEIEANKTIIVDNLTTNNSGQALSAAQGKTLQDNKVDKVTGKQLSTEDYTSAEKTKLANIESEANKTIIVDNLTTNNSTQALSAAQGKILQDNKVDKVTGKQLSTEDYTTTEKQKVATIDNKVNIAQGSANANKNVVTDENGDITTIEAHEMLPSLYMGSPYILLEDNILCYTTPIYRQDDIQTITQTNVSNNIGRKHFNCFYELNNQISDIVYDFSQTDSNNVSCNADIGNKYVVSGDFTGTLSSVYKYARFGDNGKYIDVKNNQIRYQGYTGDTLSSDVLIVDNISNNDSITSFSIEGDLLTCNGVEYDLSQYGVNLSILQERLTDNFEISYIEEEDIYIRCLFSQSNVLLWYTGGLVIGTKEPIQETTTSRDNGGDYINLCGTGNGSSSQTSTNTRFVILGDVINKTITYNQWYQFEVFKTGNDFISIISDLNGNEIARSEKTIEGNYKYLSFYCFEGASISMKNISVYHIGVKNTSSISNNEIQSISDRVTSLENNTTSLESTISSINTTMGTLETNVNAKENVSNKVNSLDTSNTNYPTCNAVNTAITNLKKHIYELLISVTVSTRPTGDGMYFGNATINSAIIGLEIEYYLYNGNIGTWILLESKTSTSTTTTFTNMDLREGQDPYSIKIKYQGVILFDETYSSPIQ